MDKKEKTIITALAVVFAVLLGVLYVVSAIRPGGTVVGEFVAPEFDAAAVSGTPEVDPKHQFSYLQMGDHIRVGLCAMPVVEQDQLQLYVASDETNDVWLMVQIFDEAGNELGRSGLFRPGEYVESVKLIKNVEPGTMVSVKFLSYEPETYYSKGFATAQILIGE